MEPIKAVSPTESGIDKSGESYRKWNQSGAALMRSLKFYPKKSKEYFYERVTMEQKRLNLYLIDIKYIRNLAKTDDHVMSVSLQTGKETRPFVGIVIVCGVQKYCIPLSSPKLKHKSMKNEVDFMKILDGEKLIGVLNFNNMIPVVENCIAPLNLRVGRNDDTATKNYKKMAIKQLDWCQRNQDAIVKKANKLYTMLQSDKVSGILKRRCCDFKKLEMVQQKWIENSNGKR